MKVVRVVHCGVILHEFPDCKIALDESWCYIITTDTAYANRRDSNVFVMPKLVLGALAVYQVGQEGSS
jgi:hypothetical protein